MTKEELKKQCTLAIERSKKLGIKPVAMFLIKGKWGDQLKKRLWRHGPLGRIVTDTVRKGTLLCEYDPVEILERLETLKDDVDN